MIEIPLLSGSANAHQTFSIQLGGRLLRFEINFLSYLDEPGWVMNIYQGTYEVATGLMLEPGSDLLEDYDTDVGVLVFAGAMTTLDNLGKENQLVWLEAY